MRRSTRLGAMVSRSWLLLLGLAAAASVLQVGGQRAPDTKGFISIDCGLPEESSYVDDTTNLPYSSDAAFTDAGINYNISAEYVDPLSRRYHTVRSFPGAALSRVCYTLPSAVPSTSMYMVRAGFKYGNYDGLKKLPAFDLYLGVNLWKTVNISDAGLSDNTEIIAVLPEETVQVCLVNIGSGTPFISALDLRPLKNSLYSQANATQGLTLIGRVNFGATDLIRYPVDPYDRLWAPWRILGLWSDVFGFGKFQGSEDDAFEVPAAVMKTAITPFNASNNIFFSFNAPSNHVDSTLWHYFFFYFAELDTLNSSQVRKFNVGYNNYISRYPHEPSYLKFGTHYNDKPVQFANRYNFTIARAENSTLPPIINACEFFSVISTANLGTDAQDASAMIAIKAKYQVKNNWQGDPCSPKTLVWDGLKCSYPVSVTPRITSVNMSFNGLSGDISSHFAKLKAIQYMDLSHNELTGSIPNELSQLPSLVLLDLTKNRLSGPIPSGLLKRVQSGSLTLRYSNNPGLCSNYSSCPPTRNKKRKSTVAVYIVVPVVAVVLLGSLLVVLLFITRKKQGRNPQDEVNDELDNRRFTYRELEVITNNFQRVVGQGGFGSVYDGFLEDGTRVAVKLRSQSSNQGVREFLTEASILARIHHKNLVSLIGYCKDKEYLALVYEYMSGGNLEEKLRGRDSNDGCFTWTQRLRIALESAQGLEYLHMACSPPFIHRDVKTSNILLDANLKAKVADFGLLKAFNHDNDTHVSTDRVVGTHGYLAPEYAAAMHLTEKSDVYSFGIVLLEVITGKPPILQCSEPTNIVQWVQQCLARGDIESVADAHMQEDYDINGVWKAADLALKCSLQAPAQRPTMTDVVGQVQECLKLEENRTGRDRNGSGADHIYASDCQSIHAAGNVTTIKMERNFGNTPTMASGPAAR